MQQAKDYAEILELQFAYATNDCEIIEFDFLTGIERKIDRYPTPDELWQRQTAGTPFNQRRDDQDHAPVVEPQHGQATTVLPRNRHQQDGQRDSIETKLHPAYDGYWHG